MSVKVFYPGHGIPHYMDSLEASEAIENWGRQAKGSFENRKPDHLMYAHAVGDVVWLYNYEDGAMTHDDYMERIKRPGVGHVYAFHKAGVVV